MCDKFINLTTVSTNYIR